MRTIDYKPNNIQLHTTNICPLRCEFCPNGKIKLNRYTLDMDTFKEYVDKCLDFGIRNFELSPCIGEPMMDYLIVDRVEYLNSKDIDSVYFFTNLLSMSDSDLERLSAFDKFKMYISVYGYDRKSFYMNTGKDYFQDFISVFEKVIREYPQLIDEFHMRFSGWETQLDVITKPLYRALKYGILSGGIKIEQLINKPDNFDWIGNLESSDEISVSQPEGNGRSGVCHFALVDNGIFPDGDVTLCHWFDATKKMVIGNVSDMESVYGEGSLYRQIITEQENGLYRSMCKRCGGYQQRCDDDPVI